MNIISNIIITIALLNFTISCIYLLFKVKNEKEAVHIFSQAITFSCMFVLIGVLIDFFNILIFIVGIILIIAMPLSSYLLMKK